MCKTGVYANFGVNYPTMYNYETVTAAVNGLKERGFTMDFNLAENCLVCRASDLRVTDFEIVEVYRFEGDTDPADEAVVYGVDGGEHGRGILVTGYGISAEGMSTEMVKKLAIHKTPE